jgi:hypothetical protein
MPSNEHRYRDSPTLKNTSVNVQKADFCPVAGFFPSRRQRLLAVFKPSGKEEVSSPAYPIAAQPSMVPKKSARRRTKGRESSSRR